MRLPYLNVATTSLGSLSQQCSKHCLSTETTTTAAAAAFARIENILILGAGMMGTGIAQSCAISGRFNSVTLHDISLDQLAKARQRIVQHLGRQIEPKVENAESILARIDLSSKYYATGPSSRNLLIIEAIPEVLPLKQSLLETISVQFAANENLIMATCSATLDREELSKCWPRPHHFAGLSFNPEPTMKMVKIIRTSSTDAQTVRLLQRFVLDLDKVCIVSSSPGL